MGKGPGSTAVAAALASGELRAVIGTEVESAADPARMMAVGYAAAMIERRLTES